MKKPFSTTCFKDSTNNIFHKRPIFLKEEYCDVILKHLKLYNKLLLEFLSLSFSFPLMKYLLNRLLHLNLMEMPMTEHLLFNSVPEIKDNNLGVLGRKYTTNNLKK